MNALNSKKSVLTNRGMQLISLCYQCKQVLCSSKARGLSRRCSFTRGVSNQGPECDAATSPHPDDNVPSDAG